MLSSTSACGMPSPPQNTLGAVVTVIGRLSRCGYTDVSLVRSATTNLHRLGGLAHPRVIVLPGTEASMVPGPGIAVLAGPSRVRSRSVFLRPPAGKGGSGPCHTASLWPPPLPLLPHRRTYGDTGLTWLIGPPEQSPPFHLPPSSPLPGNLERPQAGVMGRTFLWVYRQPGRHDGSSKATRVWDRRRSLALPSPFCPRYVFLPE